jgi:hypothetical protein
MDSEKEKDPEMGLDLEMDSGLDSCGRSAPLLSHCRTLQVRTASNSNSKLALQG